MYLNIIRKRNRLMTYLAHAWRRSDFASQAPFSVLPNVSQKHSIKLREQLGLSSQRISRFRLLHGHFHTSLRLILPRDLLISCPKSIGKTGARLLKVSSTGKREKRNRQTKELPHG